jgi:hypothetical protein
VNQEGLLNMRERTTWNRTEIAKQASMPKQADPYLMNQDHVNKQPSQDKYNNGNPSTWAEDVHPSKGSWEAEYSGDQVKRNEIGMPEMRGDTFNHSEKTASEDLLVKKANLCIKIARRLLSKKASEETVEAQALSFMGLPDSEVISTYARLANEEEQQESEEKQAGQDEQGQGQQEEKQAGQDEQGQGQQEQKQADQQQVAQMDQQAQQQMMAQMVQQAVQQVMQQMMAGQGQQMVQANQQQMAQQSQQAQQQQMAQQSQQAQQQAQAQQQMAQQQAQAQQQQMAQQGQQAQQQQMADDQLLDQMLADMPGDPGAPADMGIDLEAPAMDTGDEILDPAADADLMQLFSNEESEQAEQAQQAQQGQGKQAHAVRTASTRTVGTRPTAGVSRLGGAPQTAGGSQGRDLSGIWNSSPDVRDVFGLKLPNGRRVLRGSRERPLPRCK